MTLFYSGVQNRNNNLYSHNNINNSIKDVSSYSRILASSTNFSIPQYRTLRREKNENENENVNVNVNENEIKPIVSVDLQSSTEPPKISPIQSNIPLSHDSEYDQKLFDTYTFRHRIVINKLEKIENLLLLLIIILAFIIMKIFN